jgi:hypothetical protein
LGFVAQEHDKIYMKAVDGERKSEVIASTHNNIFQNLIIYESINNYGSSTVDE